MTTISPPEHDTRLAILKQYASQQDWVVPTEALSLIAENFTQNPAELIAALDKVVQDARGQPINPGMVESSLTLEEGWDQVRDSTGEDEGGHVEGFGLVFAEAHVYGKPVVAGRSGGTEDAVLDGETGIVIEPEDVDALAESILRLMKDPGLARKYGEAGKARVERELNWKEFCKRVMEAFEERS